jgi:hypothetical protein
MDNDTYPRRSYAEVLSYHATVDDWWLQQIKRQQRDAGSACFRAATVRLPGLDLHDPQTAEVLWDDDARAGWVALPDHDMECVVADSMDELLHEVFTYVW